MKGKYLFGLTVMLMTSLGAASAEINIKGDVVNETTLENVVISQTIAGSGTNTLVMGGVNADNGEDIKVGGDVTNRTIMKNTVIAQQIMGRGENVLYLGGMSSR